MIQFADTDYPKQLDIKQGTFKWFANFRTRESISTISRITQHSPSKQDKVSD